MEAYGGFYWYRCFGSLSPDFKSRRLTATITFHDVLHRFWVGHGIGTSAIKNNLIHQLTVIREAVLFKGILGTPEGVLHPGLEQMPRDYCFIRVQPQGDLDPSDILGLAYRGGLGRQILWPTLQGVQRSYPIIPPIPHALQRVF